MPAIVDPDGPGGRPISVFESGAILQYLGRKTGKFYPKDERARVEVDQWLMWQMGGLGPMAGQAHHFRLYAPEKLPYAIDRYTNECNRLYGVMNKRLADRPYLAGSYSIADIACVGWASRHERQGQDFAEFPHLKRWLDSRDGAAGGQEGNELAGRGGVAGRYARSRRAESAVRPARALSEREKPRRSRSRLHSSSDCQTAKSLSVSRRIVRRSFPSAFPICAPTAHASRPKEEAERRKAHDFVWRAPAQSTHRPCDDRVRLTALHCGA